MKNGRPRSIRVRKRVKKRGKRLNPKQRVAANRRQMVRRRKRR